MPDSKAIPACDPQAVTGGRACNRPRTLAKHSQEMHAMAEAKALEVIDNLDQAGEKVAVAGVSRLSGVSRATVYANPIVMKRIERSKALKAEMEAGPTLSIQRRHGLLAR